MSVGTPTANMPLSTSPCHQPHVRDVGRHHALYGQAKRSHVSLSCTVNLVLEEVSTRTLRSTHAGAKWDPEARRVSGRSPVIIRRCVSQSCSKWDKDGRPSINPRKACCFWWRNRGQVGGLRTITGQNWPHGQPGRPSCAFGLCSEPKETLAPAAPALKASVRSHRESTNLTWTPLGMFS